MSESINPPRLCFRFVWLAIAALAIALYWLNGLNAKGADLHSAKSSAAEAEKRLGFALRLTLPIKDQTTDRVKRFVSGAMEKARSLNIRPYLIFEFYVPPGREDFARDSNFGACYELANFLTSPELNAAQSVAYIPQSISGHAVLIALACDEVIMAENAEIGPAGVDKGPIGETIRAAYREIAGRRRKLSAPLALALLDPAMEILAVKTEVGTEYVSRAQLEDLKKTRTIVSTEVFKPAGETLRLSSRQARELGLASYLANNRRDLIQALDLPPLGIEDDPSLEKPWKAVRIDLKGPISGKSVRQAQKLIENQISLCDVNFVCLWIDSPGGSPADSGILADYLLSLDPSRVRTVAYIPKQARADSALIALACDQIIMHPDAVIGGLGPVEISADELALIREMIRDRLAPRKGRSWSLPTALFDGKLDVYRCTRPGEIEYFSPQELAEQPNPGQWEKGAKITTRRAPLKLDGTQAEQMGLIRRVVNNFGELSDYYGLENDPALVEPGWADTLVEALRSPAVAILLFLLGAAGLYFEFHMPGLGISAFVAVVCFVLFFWSFFLDGASGWLVSMLFLCGVGCLLLEIFVIPGFGIFGLGGGIMLVLSLVLASQLLVIPHGEAQIAEMKRSLLMLGGAAIGLFVLALLARAWLPRGSLLSGMVLAPPAEDESKRISHHELLVDLHNLVGNQGVTTTPLMPGGKARFGDSLVDVIADGEMIERGRQVEVVEVHGNRVLVREIAQA